MDVPIKLFLDSLDSNALDLVIDDGRTQVRHDELPIAYDYLKSVLLTQQQKQIGLKSGGKCALL